MLSRGSSQVSSRLLRASACWCLLFALQTCLCSKLLTNWAAESAGLSRALSWSAVPSLAPGLVCAHTESSTARVWCYKRLGLCAVQTWILDFNISPLVPKCTAAASSSWLTPAWVLRSDTCLGLWAPAACKRWLCGLSSGRYQSSISSWGGSSVLTCCLLETRTWAMWSCKTKHCWSFLSPNIHLRQRNAASATEQGGAECATRLPLSPLEDHPVHRSCFTGVHIQGQVKLSQWCQYILV